MQSPYLYITYFFLILIIEHADIVSRDANETPCIL